MNKDRNEFAIGLKQDENFRSMTKLGESNTRFVDAYDQIVYDENEIDWKQELKRWIATANRKKLMMTIQK
jgi:predicted metal-dependent peptidase